MCLSLIATALLLTFNILLGVSGIAMSIIGILLLVTPNFLLSIFQDIPDYPDLSDEIDGLINFSDVLRGSSVTLIILGAAILVLALSGTCGSLCGGVCRLVYVVLLCFVVVCVVAFIIYQSSREGKADFKEKVFRALNATFGVYISDLEKEGANNGSINVTDKAWSYYQTKKACCGVNNYRDYNKGTVPPYCCQLIDQTKVPNNTNGYTNYTECRNINSTIYLNVQGCLDSVYSEFLAGPQLGIILSAVTIPFLVGCLILSTYMMG